MPTSRQAALTPTAAARFMTRRRIPCMLSSRVIGRSSQSGSLGGVVTLGTIGQMALLASASKCQHNATQDTLVRPQKGAPSRWPARQGRDPIVAQRLGDRASRDTAVEVSPSETRELAAGD